MARARNIKPGVYKNEDLAECSVWARLLFPGLWMLADREGRIEDRPKRIKGEIFPFDAIEVDQLLLELEKWGFIHRYISGGKKCIQIKNFTTHQSPHGTEKDSELPDVNGFYTVNERMKNGCITGKFSRINHESQDESVIKQSSNESLTVNPPLDNTLNPDTRILIPDSLNPDSKTHTAATGESAGGQKPECVSLIETGFDALGDILPTGQGQDAVVIDRVAPTMAAAVCVAMRAERIADCNPSHPDINALLAQGAEIGLFASATREAVKKGKGFAYALAIVKSQIAGAQKIAAASISKQTSKGAGHAKNAEEPI